MIQRPKKGLKAEKYEVTENTTTGEVTRRRVPFGRQEAGGGSTGGMETATGQYNQVEGEKFSNPQPLKKLPYNIKRPGASKQQRQGNRGTL